MLKNSKLQRRLVKKEAKKLLLLQICKKVVQAHQAKPKKKSKKNTDADKPKKPLTPFFIFFMKRRDEIKNEYPNFNATDITELLGKEWRNLTEKEKNFYQEEFTKKYEHYKKDLKDYYESKGIDPATVKSERKKVFLRHSESKEG